MRLVFSLNLIWKFIVVFFFFLSPAIIRRLQHWATATLCIIIYHFFGNCWANFLNCAYLKFAISYFELPHADVLLQPIRADYKAVEVLSLKNSTKSKKKKSLWDCYYNHKVFVVSCFTQFLLCVWEFWCWKGYKVLSLTKTADLQPFRLQPSVKV